MKLRLSFALMLMAVFFGLVPSAGAQPASYDGRPVSDVRLQGLKHVNPQFLLNQIQTKAGDPYDARVVEGDIIRLTNLGKFSKVFHLVEVQPDGSVVVIYQVDEMPLMEDVQVVGNTVFSDQDLLTESRLTPGDPIDSFLIDRAKKAIVKKYEDAGYHDVSVSEDQEALEESRILLLKVVEGRFVRIRAIRFQGNDVLSDKELLSKIKSRKYIFLLRKGEFSREQTDTDAALIREYYRSRGYLDAEVLREVTPSPDGRNAIVTFIIKEGEQYTVERIVIDGNELFSEASILEAIALSPGSVYSANLRERSQKLLIDKYGRMGYIEAKIAVEPVFLEERPTHVEVFISIEEGQAYYVGEILIRGNKTTKESVVARQIKDQYPRRTYDGPGLEITDRRLNQSALFQESRNTILGDVSDTFRDLLIEVEEKNTGSIAFGAGVSTDQGLIGALTLTQRNFDITDWPETFDEFITGRAFRGAGQYFSIDLQPGTETSRFGANFREPYLFDSNYFLDSNIFYFTRDRNDYNEDRVGGSLGIGQRFGEVWSASIQGQAEQIDISDIDEDAAVDVFDVEGESILTSLGLSIIRNTTDDRIFPTRGSRWTTGLARAGALGGDYDFTRINSRYQKFWTVDEDFFGRRTVLSGDVQLGYIFEDNEAPLFERFYSGGRNFRGFEYRGVSPRGIRNDTMTQGDDPVGGDFLFLAGVEYNFPIFQEILRGVFFVDSGTVQKDFSFNEYRVSVGTGIRLKIPFLGDAPFALDLAYPIVKEDEDDTQYFNFDLAVPF